MLVLLPPSETKAPGGDGPPLDLDTLAHPALTDIRRELAAELSTLAHDVPESLRALRLSERQVDEVERNADLWDAPTAPALERYTGVLYDALDVASLHTEDRKRADERLAVASALFGLARGMDAIPPYRLSGGTKLPGAGSLRDVWRPVLEPELIGRPDLVVDLRSGAYAALARVPEAITARVLSEDAGGKRKVVSHHNKTHNGKLARALAETREEPEDLDDLLAVADASEIRAERDGPNGLCLVVDAST